VSLSGRSVQRPIAVLMTTLAVVVFGFLSLARLPVELLPDLSYPTLTVQTEYPDAAPVSVERFVTRPLEESVGVIAGVRDMRSVSRAGLSEVVLEFEWSQDMDLAAMEVREKIGLVELPLEADVPRVLRFDPSLDPILRLSFAGDRSLDELRLLAERWLKPRLEAVSGVAAAKVRGGLDPEIVVEADETKLAALGLTLDDLGAALEAENVNRPGGVVKDWGAVYLIRTLHEFEDLDQLRRTVVREGDTGRVRVSDVARVYRGHRDREEMTRSAGDETIEISIYREGSSNTVIVAEAVREEIEELRSEMRADLGLTVLADQSRFIEQAVSEVWSAALVGGILAILVLYFFLRDPQATGIIGVAVPVSVIAAFLPMQQAGVSLNVMSLGGLALGVGMLMDNAIVVLEAIDRHRRSGLDRARAAMRGAGDVAAAVTAATLTTVCVFLPIVFVEGVAGQLFYDLAVTVCLSLVASLAVSLTVIPALAGLAGGASWRRGTLFSFDRGVEDGGADLPMTIRIGRASLPPIGNGRHPLSKILTVVLLPLRLALLGVIALVGVAWFAIDAAFRTLTWPFAKALEALGAAYPGGLRGALRARWLVVPLTAAVFGATLWLAGGLGTDLVPELAQGQFAFQLRMDEGTPLQSTAQVVERIEAPFLDDPAFSRVFSNVGSLPSSASGRQTTGENLAQVTFVLRQGMSIEGEARAIDRVRSTLDNFEDVEAELVRPSVLSMKPPIAVEIYGDDLRQLSEAAGIIERILLETPDLEDVATTDEPGSPEIRIVPDREKAGALGVRVDTVARSLRGHIRGDIVGLFREGEERLDIRLRSSERARTMASGVDDLRVRLDSGQVVPVSAVADIVRERGPAAIHRANGSRMAEVTATAPGADLGRAIDAVSARIGAAELPIGVVAEIAGQDEELQTSLESLRLALALAIFLVYVVMAVQFESLLHPLVILLSVPLGLIGVVAALFATGTTISVLVLIGVVMLAGIVVNNAIVLVDAVNRRRRDEGQALEEAIVGAGRERLRPILMTTATTVLGLTPLALGLGAGSELRAPLAITVIGGLAVSTVLTLVVVPCLYRIFSPNPATAATESATRDAEGAGGEPVTLGDART
jgi:HAE1 family hydrophobic/amphiphilic exporter-1